MYHGQSEKSESRFVASLKRLLAERGVNPVIRGVVAMSSRIRIQRHDGRWLVIDDNIKDDCPIISDWDTKEEATIEVNRVLREELQRLLGTDFGRPFKRAAPADELELPETPLSERGFGV